MRECYRTRLQMVSTATPVGPFSTVTNCLAFEPIAVVGTERRQRRCTADDKTCSLAAHPCCLLRCNRADTPYGYA